MKLKAIARLHGRAQRLKATLWTLIVAPSAWAAHFLVCYVAAAVVCEKLPVEAAFGWVRLVVGLATGVALAIIAATAFVAFAQTRIEGDPPPHDESTDEDRLRFLAVSTLMLAGLSAVAVIYVALPALIFETCR